MVGVSGGAVLLSEVTINQDLAMGAHNISLDADQTVDGEDITDMDSGHPDRTLKIVSDTLVYSHDADVPIITGSWTVAKRITFNGGVRGAIRVKWEGKNNNNDASCCGESKLIDSDGVIIGSLHQNGCSNVSVFVYSEDIDPVDIEAGGYIELTQQNAGVSPGAGKVVNVADFRIYFDNIAGGDISGT